MRCPTCHTEYPAGVRFCALDARPLLPASQLEAGATQSTSCRGCGRAFDLSIRFCPFDGAELGALSPAVIAAPPARPALATVARVSKICPHCNQRYAINDAFCGRDGSTLVPLN